MFIVLTFKQKSVIYGINQQIKYFKVDLIKLIFNTYFYLVNLT